MSLRSLILFGFGVCIAITAALAGISILTIGNQASPLETIEAKADATANQGIPLLLALKDLRYDVVQVQQFLTDVSATGNREGFGEAEEYAKRFAADLTQAQGLAGRMGLGELESTLNQLSGLFNTYPDYALSSAELKR